MHLSELPWLGHEDMNVTKIIDTFGYAIYGALAFLAVWGVYNGILLYRTLSKKSLDDPQPLLDQVRELCEARKFDAAVSVCQSPTYWHKALAQLIAVALRNRDKGLAKMKQLLVTEFHTEVIAGMENRLASLSTIVRMGPLLGLLGTVASMIAAFSRIGGVGAGQPPPARLGHQPGALGDRRGPADRQPDDADRQRRPCPAAAAPGPDRAAAPGGAGDPRAAREPGHAPVPRGIPIRARSRAGGDTTVRACSAAQEPVRPGLTTEVDRSPCSFAVKRPRNATSTST